MGEPQFEGVPYAVLATNAPAAKQVVHLKLRDASKTLCGRSAPGWRRVTQAVNCADCQRLGGRYD